MLRLVVRGLLVMAISSAAAAAAAGDLQQYAVDRQSSRVAFTVAAKALFTIKRDGTFENFDGKVSYDPARPVATSVDLTIYTASVDLKSADQEDLLRSEEFFDVGHHPTMHFVSTAVNARGDGLLDVSGDLTIRGVTRRVVVPMAILNRPGADGSAVFDTRFQIDRTEYGLNGGGPKARGFKVSVGKIVDIHLTIAAKTALPGRQ